MKQVEEAPERIWITPGWGTWSKTRDTERDISYIKVPPVDEEAETILREHGTSGKEVVNGFIERLLTERLALTKQVESLRAELERLKTEVTYWQDENVKSHVWGSTKAGELDTLRAEIAEKEKEIERLKGAVVTYLSTDPVENVAKWQDASSRMAKLAGYKEEEINP